MNLRKPVQCQTFVFPCTGPVYREIDLCREFNLLNDLSLVKVMKNVMSLTFAVVGYESGEFGDSPSRMFPLYVSEVRKPSIFVVYPRLLKFGLSR